MALYESEYTKFLREQRAQHPEWEREQEEGFLRLWNSKLDLDAQKDKQESNIPQRAYPYDVHF